MKAVILAGGEGTRLRPLTSNQPKPMMPIANVPMMEHIVRLLARARLRRHRRHGRVPRQPHPQLLRRRLRVRRAHAVRDRGVAARHRRLGPQRDGRARRDVPRDLRRRAHRHRPRRDRRARTATRGAFATIALKRVENPVEFGIVITRDDGTIERFLEKPTWGEVFSDTINTGIYVLEPGVFDFIPEGEVVDFSGDVFPAVLDAGPAAARHVVDGYWEDVGTLEAYRTAHEDILDGRVQHRDPRLPARATACGSARAPTSRPTPRSTARCSSATTRRVEAGAVLAPVHRARRRRRREGRRATSSARVVHDHVYIGHSARLRGAVDRPRQRPPRATRASRRAS